MNTMQEFIDDADETLSLSDLQIDPAVDSEEFTTQNKSSSSSSSFDEDFFGFFSEEWSRNTSFSSYNTSPEQIIFCGKVISSKGNTPKPKAKSETSLLFRSNSDSFSYKRSKKASKPGTSRSKSLPTTLPSTSKSRWQVFAFGFGSGKFPTTMELSDIKSRQLRRQSTTKVSRPMDGGEEESGGRRSGNKGWWRLVDVLGCGGGYSHEKETMVVNV